MHQREITQPTPLLNARGHLATPGYARRMHFNYDPSQIRARPFALKEWDFYQVQLSGWILTMTIGHVSYASSVDATLFNPDTGERHHIGRLAPLGIRNMGNSPDVPHRLEAKTDQGRIIFDRKPDSTRLKLTSPTGAADIDILLPRNPGDDHMVIATPFDKPNQFYLNNKEHFYNIEGYARIGDCRVETSPGDTALLDWGRGVWPFTQEWYWGCGSGWCGGRRFGFNIGWGFGDLSNATENMFFVDGKAVKLGALRVDMPEGDFSRPWRYTSEDGRFDLFMTPRFDNYTETKLLWVDNNCHQVFGTFHGHVTLDSGERLTISNIEAFVEHAHNRW